MSNAIVQVGPSVELSPGHTLIRAVLGGTIGSEDMPLLNAWADGVYAAVKSASKEGDRAACVLLDLSTFETYTDPGMITFFAELMKKDAPYVHRTATFGGNMFDEMAVEVIEGMAHRNNLRNFKTEAEAMAWLKE